MISLRVNEILNEKGKSKYWLSHETGITYANICRLSNNNTNSINFNTLDKLCIALECEPNDIIKKE